MKKVLALILVLVLAVILCVSCSQKKEEKAETTEELVTFTFYNRTGETVDKLTIVDNISKREMTTSGLPDGAEHETGLTVVLENGAPSLTLSFETKTSQYGAPLMQKGGPVTLLPVTGEGDRVVFSKPED